MDKKIERLNTAINRLFEKGVIKKGQRKVCLTLELRALEESDRVVDKALTKALHNAKTDT